MSRRFRSTRGPDGGHRNRLRHRDHDDETESDVSHSDSDAGTADFRKPPTNEHARRSSVVCIALASVLAMLLPGCGAKTGLRVPERREMPIARVDLALGSGHTCARRSDGSVWCWGDNRHGQLGDGSITQRATPVRVVGLPLATHISATYQHTCARVQNGTVWCWGANDGGQVALEGGDRTMPVRVPALTGVAEVRAGSSHTCARLVDGTVSCWGSNGCGILGYETADRRTRHYRPERVPGLVNVARLDTADRSFAVLTDGSTRGWPVSCSIGGFAAEVVVSEPLPWYRDARAPSTAVDGVQQQSGVVLRDGTIRGPHCTLLYGGTQVSAYENDWDPGLTNVAQLEVGPGFSCARLDDGSVQCWGNNASGALGDGTGATQLNPVPVAGLTHVETIETGETHGCAGLDDGRVWCWGGNRFGQLGTGGTRDSRVPVEVQFPEPAGDVAITSGAGSPVTVSSSCAPGDVRTYEHGCPPDETRTVCRAEAHGEPTQTYCGCDGATFTEARVAATRPWAYFGACRVLPPSGVMPCEGRAMPLDGDRCDARDRDERVECREGAIGGGLCGSCSPACTCGADLRWRCVPALCAARVEHDGDHVDATEFYLTRCVPR